MGTKVHFLASERHYIDHLLPVYAALPASLRGEFIHGTIAPRNGITAVSSVGDLRKVKGPAIYFEHGVGHSYSNDHPSYAGGRGKDNVRLFLSTNQRVADKNTETYPDTPQVVIGCPKLDAWVGKKPLPARRPSVAFSFHWDCQVAPETRSAMPYYIQSVLAAARLARNWTAVGHGHPRLWPEISRLWKHERIPRLMNFNDVVATASVYVCDNSSTMYEFAALDRPVVVLNAPWYRKDINHGLRFWEDLPGVQVDKPDSLKRAIDDAFRNDTYAAERQRVTSVVYPHLGYSTELAVEAIKTFC